MSLSDDARTAIANVTADPDDFTAGGRTIALACADEILAVVMPDGRTIAQHLDDGAVALFNAMGHDWHDAAAVVRDMFPTDALEAAAAKVQEAEG